MKQVLKILTIADKFLITFLIIGTISSFFVLTWTSSEGAAVMILADGGETLKYPLDHNREFAVQGPLGVTQVVIHDHRAWIASSACPNKLCIHMGSIHRAGEMVVCVPNRVSVRVVGEKKNGVDATTM